LHPAVLRARAPAVLNPCFSTRAFSSNAQPPQITCWCFNFQSSPPPALRRPTQPLPLWQGRRRLAAASPRDVKGYSRRVWLVVVGQGVEKIVESTTSMFVKKSTVGPSATAEPVFLFLGWLARELGIPGIKRGVEKLSP